MTTINQQMSAVTRDEKIGLSAISNGFHICRRGFPDEDDHWFVFARVDADEIVAWLLEIGRIPVDVVRDIAELQPEPPGDAPYWANR